MQQWRLPATLSLTICAPLPGEGRHAIERSGEAEHDKSCMHPLQRPPLLTRLPRLGLQPACQLRGKRIKFDGPLRRRKGRLDRPRAQILLGALRDRPVRLTTLGRSSASAVPRLRLKSTRIQLWRFLLKWLWADERIAAYFCKHRVCRKRNSLRSSLDC